ncbi:MAG: hypothetical protein JW740_00195 [Candidatus Zambryskibacteria bacterium]|nr:hypothetical protein [Candidatus Zambryskibacteria bacterium]
MNNDKESESWLEGWNFDAVEMTVVLLFLTAIVGAIVPNIINYFISGEISFYGIKLVGIIAFFKSTAFWWKILSLIIALFAMFAAYVFTQKWNRISREERAKVYPSDMLANIPMESSSKDKKNEKWERIVKLSESENSSDWRLAIIEADIMLDELLEKLKLPGDTMADKMKVVEKSDFVTIDLAWEAHKARNKIAHEGNDFLVNQREIRRIISLYEAVFKEFYLI